jgi:hypothetical protein
MPSVVHVFFCSIAALLFWGVVGYAVSRRLAPAALALPIAPALGWALQSAVALPVYRLAGFTPLTVLTGSLLFLGAACLGFRLPDTAAADDSGVRVPRWAYALAAALAVVPVLALFPKFSGDAATLSGPIFDHSKIAIIDEMTRLGLPPGNPFFGGGAHDAPLAYYYLWHFSAAELALIPGISGWESDIALSAFTAFSSIALMMGFATWIGKRPAAGVWVIPLAFAASLHPILEAIFGAETFYSYFLPPTGFAGWLFQTTWAPQHVASASCVMLSSCFLLRLAHRPSVLSLVVLSLLAVAGFESSTWVGGILFAGASPVMAGVLLANAPPDKRLRFVGSLVIAALLAAALAYPFLYDQFLNAAGRGVGSPIALKAASVLDFPDSDALRRALDIPAYWLALLVIEFPAMYVTGAISIVATMRGRLAAEPALLMTRLLFALALVSLLMAGWLTITFADNNDLGWRAVLPAVLILTVYAATGLARWIATPAPFLAAAGLGLLLLALPRSIQITAESMKGLASGSAKAFAASPDMWAAVRRHAGPAERVANNPLSMGDVTPWPVNISWALFADRASCFAGSGLALPFTSLPRDRVDAIDTQFRRVFDGSGDAGDVRDLATRFQCRVAVVTPQDGAWANDPFARSDYYALAEEKPGAWKIYRAK